MSSALTSHSLPIRRDLQENLSKFFRFGMLSKTQSKDDSRAGNYYTLVPKKFQAEERTYPRFEQLHIKIPFRMVLTGASGSGKTNALIRLFDEMNCFERVLLFARCLHEPLYAFLIDVLTKVEERTGHQILLKSKDITDLPAVDKLNDKLNNLFICDDMVNEKSKQLAKVADYWVMGRKFQGSCCFLTQSYFDAPTIIRKNSTKFVFTLISTQRDLVMILKDFRLGVNEDQIMDLYHEATKDGFPNFFMVDTDSNLDPQYRFRRNFEPLLTNNVPMPLTPVSTVVDKKVRFNAESEVKEIDSHKDERKTKRVKSNAYARHFEDQPEHIQERLIANETDEERARRLGHFEATSSASDDNKRNASVANRLKDLSKKLKQPVTKLREMAKGLGLTALELCDRLEDAINAGEYDDVIYPQGKPSWRPVPLAMRQ